MKALLTEMRILREHAQTHMHSPARESHVNLIDRVIRSLNQLDALASEGDPCGMPNCPAFGCDRVCGCACQRGA